MKKTNGWNEANQHDLATAVAEVAARLERHAGLPASRRRGKGQGRAPRGAASTDSAPMALGVLCEALGLSPFERSVLLLCAGMELDGAVAGLCAAGQGEPRRTHPTFSLALSALPGAHWSALSPSGPLRRWRLIELGAGDSLLSSTLRIDECILHFLTGVPYHDERLSVIGPPLPSQGALPPSQRSLAERVAAVWRKQEGELPVVHLRGADPKAMHAIAAAACEMLGRPMHLLYAGDIPAGFSERDALLCLWERDAILSGRVLLLDSEEAAPESAPAMRALVERLQTPLIICGREVCQTRRRALVRLEVGKPTAPEQLRLWQEALGPAAAQLNGQLEHLVSQFDFGVAGISESSLEVRKAALQGEPELAAELLWESCLVQARPRLEPLALRIEPAASWEHLVLPDGQKGVLREMAAQVRHRARVYGEWGFGGKGVRGLGISALFSGVSGTGKTMAAEVLAGELRLDLYRIDLSAVISKYIGETEKNLRRVFDAAEDGGMILLFDEADALFGKRSEVKDSHDRYANIEISYLLQRMEAYRGLSILTSNMKSALDSAFLRRIRFIVEFPFPAVEQRAEIWRHIFPKEAPLRGVDVDKLARLNMAGGNIRNIALNAAFRAAEAGEPLDMGHLLHAARSEYSKLERPLTDSEISGWQ